MPGTSPGMTSALNVCPQHGKRASPHPPPPIGGRIQPWIVRPDLSSKLPPPLISVPLSNSNYGDNVPA